MTTPSRSVLKKIRHTWWLAAGIVALAALTWGFFTFSRSADPAAAGKVGVDQAAGPPWRYGPASARFTVVVYADLECPFCQPYTPTLRSWIDAHRDINLQWHHLPLAMHEPAAGEEARWVECVGETFGHARFWEAVTWVYQHTRGAGQGLPPGTAYPDDAAVKVCLDSERPGKIVRNQADQARRDGFDATPSLRLVDNHTERSIALTGSVVGDTLLSALDLLSSPEQEGPRADALSGEAHESRP
ncbi:TPA: thioredoxin domain-containing protein [Pseudomonas putida]|nr:thioredoxin domain-containing protein [Pseudomonas putida]HDS1803028.1 thioredoxin domain-containing protein [Pseudomonas putida]HDS1808962.1 thioredoxin domain-containing protein [Pseudomonas putida]